MGILISLLTPFIGSILAIFAALLGIVNTSIMWLGPVLFGVSSFVMWFIAQFFKGLGVIIQNLSTLAVIVVLVLATYLYIHHNDKVILKEAIQTQKTVDAKKCVCDTPTKRKPVIVSKHQKPVFPAFPNFLMEAPPTNSKTTNGYK